MVDQILQLKCTFIGSEMGGEIDCNKAFSRDKSGKNMHTSVTQMKQRNGGLSYCETFLRQVLITPNEEHSTSYVQCIY